jgi:uncharacterized OB-fold protein
MSLVWADDRATWEDEMVVTKAPSPALFSEGGTEALPERPALLGGRCAGCGYVFFPMQAYGCERCGGEALEPCSLTGRGTLVASAKVFLAAGEHRPAPFIVGSVITDDGAVVRSILEVGDDEQLTPGAWMVTKLVPELRPDRAAFDLRFILVAAE